MERFEDYGIFGVRPISGEQSLRCPKCSDNRRKRSTRPLSVNYRMGVWNCHHCGFKGTIKHNHFMNQKTVFLGEKKKYNKPTFVNSELSQEHFEYLTNVRKLSKECLLRNKISTTPSQRNPAVSAISFPFYENKECVNVKYRILPKDFAQSSGGKPILYKIDDTEDATFAILCEGEIDALSFETAGFKEALSIPMGALAQGTNTSIAKMEYLDNSAEYISHIEKFYLALDKDGPGMVTQEEIARRIGRHKCWIVPFPDGCKDANEVLTKHGPDELKSCIERAIPYPIEGIINAIHLKDEVEYIFEHGYPEIGKSGFGKLDEYLRFAPGFLTVFTGAPNTAKSTALTFLNVMLSLTQGWKHAIFSPENYPIETHIHQMIEQIVGKTMLPDYNNRMTKDEMMQALDFIKDHFWFIRSMDSALTLDEILERASALVLRFGVNSLVIDPWNQIEHKMEGGFTETTYAGHMLKKIREFNQKYNVHTFLVAHPRKLQKDNDGINYLPANLYDVAGSANFYNMADNGIIMHRHKEIEGDSIITPYSEMIVEKVRHKSHGRPGKFKLIYNQVNSRLEWEGSNLMNVNLLHDIPSSREAMPF